MRNIPDKEDLRIEFKSDLKKLQNSDIFDSVVAFANTDGGTLFVGVEDDGLISGAHPDHLNPISLAAYIANNTIPPISVRAEIVEEERPVLAIQVPKASSGIVATTSGKVLRRRLKADGSPENVPLYPSEMATRLSDLRLLDYSALPLLEASLDDFDPLELERLKKMILSYDGDKSLLELNNIDLYKALHFVKEEDGKFLPTIAGLLMLGRVDSIKRFVPTATSAFQVLEGTKVRINDDFILPILASIEKINNYLEAWNPEQEIEVGLFRIAAPDFNKQALREAIINAYSHRDYSKMGRVRVAIADNGLTIANPGGFIEGVSVDNLLTAEPHGRNPILSDALKRVGLAEKTGRGIDRIFEGSLIYGRLLPDYSMSTNVTVTLFIPRSVADVQMASLVSNEQNRLGRPLPINTLLVLNVLKNLPRSNIVQIANATNLSDTTVKIIVEKSVEAGLVEAYGSGRGRNYSLSNKLYKVSKKSIGYVNQKDIDEARYYELVLNMAKNNEYISRADVINLLHVTEDKAYRILKALTNQKKLEPINKGRYAKYHIVK